MSVTEQIIPQSPHMAYACGINGTIHERFSEVAERVPTRIAITCDGRQITYRGLDAWSDRIAADLRARRVAPGQLVGLYANRSAEAIAAILGILKAGAAYVPFDPAYPPKLLRHIYEDSKPAMMLVQCETLNETNTPTFWDGKALDLQAWPDADAHPLHQPRLAMFVAPSDPAYVMYTSGSTGRPKGVLVPHKAVLRLVIDTDYAHFGEDEVLLGLAPLSFDASTFEIWAALLHGGTLAILPMPHPSFDDIADAIARHGVTTMWLTAGLFHLMVDHRLNGLNPLRQLLAGGDVLSASHVQKALAALPNCQLINGYGPTENTTFSCCYRIPHNQPADEPIPIGTPIAHTQAYVLDDTRQPVPAGDEGDLYVGGDGLALGYLNRPDLTAERFVPNPFDPQSGARLYRTGDRVRLRSDGSFEFMGRVDRQIKLNGKRIELDEIEACLRRTGLVRDAAVTTYETEAGQRRIAAFVSPLAGQTLNLDRLRDHLRQELPDFMLPTSLVAQDALPLSPTGKVDRAKLIVPRLTPVPAPTPSISSAVESALLSIWCQVLSVQTINREQNFFDLGGSSLQLMQVQAEIRSKLGYELSMVELFRNPRISLLAAYIDRAPSNLSSAEPELSDAEPTTAPSARERAARQNETLLALRNSRGPNRGRPPR